jgi:membrane-associated phospholipid phosphatase
VAGVAGSLFMVLAVLVETGATASLDAEIRDALRPDNVWGPSQARLNPIIDGIDPPRALGLLAAVGLVLALRRRSWWPGLYAALVAVAAVGPLMVTKFLVARPDPRHEMTAVGGSFPSGHLLAVVVCLGGCLMLLVPRTRWWQWLPIAVIGSLMGAALVVCAAHWFTDVVGGALLAIAMVGLLEAFPPRHLVFRRGVPLRAVLRRDPAPPREGGVRA